MDGYMIYSGEDLAIYNPKGKKIAIIIDSWEGHHILDLLNKEYFERSKQNNEDLSVTEEKVYQVFLNNKLLNEGTKSYIENQLPKYFHDALIFGDELKIKLK